MVMCLIFILLGDEFDSLCGCIYFIKDMLENDWLVDEKVVKYIDCCLFCFVCMMMCLLGVYYMYLVDYVWVYIEKIYKCFLSDWLMWFLFLFVLFYLRWFCVVLIGVYFGCLFVGLLKCMGGLLVKMGVMFELVFVSVLIWS